MYNLFQENKRIFFILITLLFILLIILYFIVLQPIFAQKRNTENSSEGVNTTISQLQQELADTKDEDTFDPEKYTYDKKLPESKELDELLLKFEKMEAISSNRIIKMDFSYVGSIPETGVDKTGDETEETETSTEESSDESTKEDIEPAIDISNKPEALQPIIIDMEVAAPDHDHFQQFLTEIEKEERLTVVSTLEFEKPAEQELVRAEEPIEEVVFKIQLMTFYYEK